MTKGGARHGGDRRLRNGGLAKLERQLCIDDLRRTPRGRMLETDVALKLAGYLLEGFQLEPMSGAFYPSEKLDVWLSRQTLEILDEFVIPMLHLCDFDTDRSGAIGLIVRRASSVTEWLPLQVLWDKNRRLEMRQL